MFPNTPAVKPAGGVWGLGLAVERLLLEQAQAGLILQRVRCHAMTSKKSPEESELMRFYLETLGTAEQTGLSAQTLRNN